MSADDKRSEAGVPHPENRCQRCGGENFAWSVDSDRFNTAIYSVEIVCPSCFVKAHEAATGMRSAWELVPRMFKWIEGAERPTPWLPARQEGDFVTSRYGRDVVHIWLRENGQGVATMACGRTLYEAHLLHGDGDWPSQCEKCWDAM